MYKAYASYFVSYFLSKIKKVKQINNIILFGSAAKNEATKASDIDVFIDVGKKTKILENEAESILNDFYKSREALLFKVHGVKNKINLVIGKLEGWKDLKESIESTGIVLYGHYIASAHRGKKQSIISWNKVEKNRGAFLNKLYGFKTRNKRYKGLIEMLGGKKLGKSTIMVPVEHREKITELLRRYRVDAQIIEVYY